jgi:hypothetical protein
MADTTVVEDLRLDHCLSVGILVRGNSNILRNTQVANTHGETNGSPGVATEVYVVGSSNAVLNNDVTETVAINNGDARGIWLNPSDRSVIEGNRVERTSGTASHTSAILINGSNNVLVINNRIVR